MSVYIIAEAGCNHLGAMDRALEMVREASRIGCNAIKFQAYLTAKINDISLHEDLTEWRLNQKQFVALKKECEYLGIDFLCSSFDIESARMLEEIGIVAHKVPSGQIHNVRYLEYIASTNKLVYLSTGMCTLDEVVAAVKIFRGNSLVIMHCTTGYPVPSGYANLNCIKEYQQMGYLTGFSDHTMSGLTVIAAVALGVKVVEHHFAIHPCNTPDMPVSLDVNMFKQYIQYIRDTECILGDGIKKIEECEKKHLHRRDYDIIQT